MYLILIKKKKKKKKKIERENIEKIIVLHVRFIYSGL